MWKWKNEIVTYEKDNTKALKAIDELQKRIDTQKELSKFKVDTSSVIINTVWVIWTLIADSYAYNQLESLVVFGWIVITQGIEFAKMLTSKRDDYAQALIISICGPVEWYLKLRSLKKQVKELQKALENPKWMRNLTFDPQKERKCVYTSDIIDPITDHHEVCLAIVWVNEKRLCNLLFSIWKADKNNTVSEAYQKSWECPTCDKKWPQRKYIKEMKNWKEVSL